jgi:hypothetical protein
MKISELVGVVRIVGVKKTARLNPKPVVLTAEQVADVAECEVEELPDGNYGSKKEFGAWRVLHVAIDADKAALEVTEDAEATSSAAQ